MDYIDLRSDTVTKPTLPMLEAMLTAKVGDDVYGEDPTVNALQQKVAEMFGMEAGLFCPSGTMTNQIAVKCHTQPLDEVIMDETSHVYQYEGGGLMFNSGVSVRLLRGQRGKINADMIEESLRAEDIHFPKSSLVIIENTANMGGGSFYKLDEIEAIYHVCKMKGLKLHLDGARIFNALESSGEAARDYGQFFDSISICLSKGLGAPVGSLLLGSEELINKAKRIRKVLGGAMRQAGILAAAGLYALEHHIDRLHQDHYHARQLAQALEKHPCVKHVYPVETNIIVFEIKEQYSAAEFVEKLKQQHILCNRFGHQKIRWVTHLDINEQQVEYILAKITER